MRCVPHEVADAAAAGVDDLDARLVHDAFEALERYRVPIEGRDPVKSLDEDRAELLLRVRAALAPLASKHPDRLNAVTQVLCSIDDMLATSVPART